MNIKKIFKRFQLAIAIVPFFCMGESFDLSIMGSAYFADGLGRQSIGTIECLKDLVKINYLSDCRRATGLENVDIGVRDVLFNKDKTPGKVILYETLIPECDAYKRLPEDKIRIAYSMTEGTRISSQWADVLNNYFDAVAVPSKFLVDVYKKSGVKKPIFYLPLGVYLDNFLNNNVSEQKNLPRSPFVFGSTECLTQRKNHVRLIQAFIEEFGDNENVILRLNGRKFWMSIFKDLKQFVDNAKVKNVHITEKTLSWQEYTDFMASLDCFVNISLGEGYSIIPREAMAMGIPCVLTDNFAQKELCQAGFVRVVPANIAVPAHAALPTTIASSVRGPWISGDCYDCSLADVRKALRDMYDNYSIWFDKAQKNRMWASQFTWQSLQKKYLNLVRPKKLILGTKNKITDDYLETKCPILYKKYCAILEL